MSTITTRAGKGSPLTNNEVDANFTNLNTDKAELSGAAFTGNITFTDNSKAIFGAGSDLQIYHDGGNSWVKDNGDGVLALASNGNGVGLYNADGTKPMLFGTVDADVKIYHDGNLKLATTSTGIDVTGTAVTDGLTVAGATTLTHSGTTLSVDRTGGATALIELKQASVIRGYLGADSTKSLIAFNGSGAEKFSVSNAGIDVTGTVTSTGILEASDGTTGEMQLGLGTALTTGAGTYDSTVRWNGSSGNLLFSQGAVEKMRIGNSGIDVTGTVVADGVKTDHTDGFYIDNAGTTEASWTHTAATGSSVINVGRSSSWGGDLTIKTDTKSRALFNHNGDISFYEDTGTTAKLFWDASAESLGIGTSSPSHPLTIQGSGTSGNAVKIVGDSTNNTGRILWRNSADSGGTGSISVDSSKDMVFGTGTSAVERMRIDATGQTTITADGNPTLTVKGSAGAYSSFLVLQAAAGGGSTINATGATSSYLNFQVDGSNKMRIDSAGNLLVGTTAALGSGGTTISSDGYVYASNDNTALYLNRQGVDGAIAEFRKGGTTVGSIGTANNDLVIGTADTNLWFDDGANAFNPASSITLGASNGVIDLGSSGRRFKDLHLSGTVNLTGGKISSYAADASAPYFADAGNVGIRLSQAGVDDIVPCSTTGADRDNAINLGSSGARFKDLYLSGGVYLGGTGAVNKLDDYEEGTWTPTVNAGVTSPTYGGGTIGLYTKIGNLVNFSCRLQVTGGTRTASHLAVTGLPFSSALGIEGGAYNWINGSIARSTPLPILSIQGTNIYFYETDGSTFIGTELTTNAVFTVHVSGTFRV